MSADAKWGDLAPRILSAILLVLVGGIEIYIGGWPFSVMVWIICGLMAWELARMFQSSAPVAFGLLSGVALALSEILPALQMTHYVVLPVLLAAVLVGMGQVGKDRRIFATFAIWVLAGCYAILMLRHVAGLGWVIWLVAVVVVSDIAGYFAGRLLGGPKFWPQISPKKTWSGTVAGWLGAAVIGVCFAGVTKAGMILVPLSVLTAFAGQMGDIAESAVKRRTFVKDSSSLIPGHGGVLDRFDAMLGAAFLLFLLWLFDLMPGMT